MRKGFTLIELMIVIAIIAIIAAIAIPNLLESRVTANESAASTSLKSGVFAAQVLFQGGGNQDADIDNVGEYGTLEALAGLTATTKMPVGQLRMLTGAFSNPGTYSGTGTNTAATGDDVDTFASAKTSGYVFTCWTASETTAAGLTNIVWVEGAAAPAAIVAADLLAGLTANNGERTWLASAVPEKYSDTGRRVFFMCQDGQIRSPAQPETSNVPYGAITAPAPGAAPTATGVSAFMAYAVWSDATDPTINSGNKAAVAGDVAVAKTTALDRGQAYYTIFSK